MKILLLYTPRSGSTSILNYYKDLNPTHKTSNFPFRFKKFAGSRNLNYNEVESLEALTKYNNLFVKNEISIILRNYGKLKEDFRNNYVLGDFTNCPTLEDLELVFDKIVILTRRNLNDQAESILYASRATDETSENLFHTKINYQTSSDEFDMKKLNRIMYKSELSNEVIENNLRSKYSIYYYEDLYINGNFGNFFKELEIEYKQDLFNRHLNSNNKYRLLNSNTKNRSSII